MGLMTDWTSVKIGLKMTRGVIAVPSHASLSDAQKLAEQNNIDRLAVVANGILVGVITRHDIVRLLRKDVSGREFDQIKVSEAMSAPIILLHPTHSLSDAAKTMVEKQISSVLIVDGAQVVGIITKSDLCREYGHSAAGEKVENWMTREVFTVQPRHSTFFVISTMIEHNVSRIPVVDDKLRGIITVTDIARSVQALPKGLAAKSLNEIYDDLIKRKTVHRMSTAADLMTPDPITTTSESFLSDIAMTMTERHIGGLPVVDRKNRLAAIITKSDIIRAIAASK